MRIAEYIFIIMILSIFYSSCGGSSEENPSFNDTIITELGIKFVHNNFYTDEELEQAIVVVDEYYDLMNNCAQVVYPEYDFSNPITQPNQVKVVVEEPLLNDDGREYFLCSSSPTGKCAGEFNIETGVIFVPPSLSALGHEIGHFFNFQIFGITNHDPEDLSIKCAVPSICHLYSDNHLSGC